MAKDIFVPDYKTGALYGYLINKIDKIFINKSNYIEFKDENEFVAQIHEQENDLKSNFSSKKIDTIILKDLFFEEDIFNEYEYIICPEYLEHFIASKLKGAYVECINFADSFEGKWWKRVFSLRTKPYNADDFQNITFLNTVYKEPMPYVQYSNIVNDSFYKKINDAKNSKQLYELLTRQLPKLNVKSTDCLNNKIFIKKHIFGNKFFIINHHIASIIKKPVLELKFEFNAQKHTKWQNKYIKSSKEKYAKLYAKEQGIKFDSINLYSYVLKKAGDEIKARLKGKKYDVFWKNNLENSGLEYIKILNKANNLIQLFINWVSENNFCSYEFDSAFFFYDKKVKVFADISWSDKSSSLKLNQLKDESYYIISTNKIQEIKTCEEKPSQNTSPAEDLFYWDDMVFE